MKAGIHPTYYTNTQVTCSCGSKFVTGSTLSEIKVEICSKCHPFFTGEVKYVDLAGRVDKFRHKQQLAQKQRQKKIKPAKQIDSGEPLSLKQMLQGAKRRLTSTDKQ